MLSRILAGPALAVALLVTVAPAARADFALVSQDLTVNKQSDVANFALTFNQAPDFSTVDSLGRPANSFQVEFDGAADTSSDLTAVVRGDEIHVANTVNVRSPTGDGGANSGGWGPIVGAVPFSLTGTTISFSVPLEDLGYTGADWKADIFSLSFGDLTAQQTVSSIPAPPAFWGGLAGLTFVAGLSIRQSMNRRRLAGGFFNS